MENTVTMTTLNLVPPGERCAIRKLGIRGALRRRLLDMGMAPGAEIEVIRIAPLGDPIEIKIKGFLLSIRKEDAVFIQVETDAQHAQTETPHKRDSGGQHGPRARRGHRG
jgi:Fe2+ transport system protein FeoA